MRVNEYFSYESVFQTKVEKRVNGNGVIQPNSLDYIHVPVIQRFNEDPISIILNNATGEVTTVQHREPGSPEQAGILWSIIGTRDYCMDIDAYGLTDTWFVNLECVAKTILAAHSIADEALSVLVDDGAILQLLTRFDEPIDSDQATRGELGYRSHNATVSLNGVI